MAAAQFHSFPTAVPRLGVAVRLGESTGLRLIIIWSALWASLRRWCSRLGSAPRSRRHSQRDSRYSSAGVLGELGKFLSRDVNCVTASNRPADR